MIEVLDKLTDAFPLIIISDEDKNGKQYKNTRWLFLKNKERYHNVFIEVWEHPKKGTVDVVLYRDLMTPDENAIAEINENDRVNRNRGKLTFYGFDGNRLLDYIKHKVDMYCSNLDL